MADNVIIKDGLEANVSIKTVPDASGDQVQVVLVADPITKDPVALSTESTALQILNALQVIQGAAIQYSYLDVTSTPGVIYEYSSIAINSNLADTVWRISKYTIATDILLWADGNTNYDNAANSLTTITYS
jgi:hypothetical protein